MKIYMSQNRHITRERIAVSHLKAETYVQKVIFSSFKISILIFKFIADIDEVSPSEDEAAAQRALHGVEGRNLHSEGSIFYFNKNLYSYSNSLQIFKMLRQETSLTIIEREIDPINHQVNNNLSMQQDASFSLMAT